MALGILGKKIGMTRVFDEKGVARSVTVVQAGPCPVLAVRTLDNDGYSAIQIGFAAVAPKKLSKPMQGVFQVLGTDAFKHLAEFRCEGVEQVPANGDVLSVEMFTPGEPVDVRGRSKGHGFSGSIKRHNFEGGKSTHGSKFHRAPGSIGTNTTPGRVKKGQKLPGQFGNKFRTIPNLKVLDRIVEENLLLIVGSVPGAVGSLLKIEKAS